MSLYLGIMLIALGVIAVYPPAVKEIIRLSNILAGVKTQITKQTILYHRLLGIILIIGGLLVLLGLSPF